MVNGNHFPRNESENSCDPWRILAAVATTGPLLDQLEKAVS